MEIYTKLKTADFVVIGVYLFAVVALGFWVSYRRRGSEDLFLGDRSFGWFNVGLSIFGTNVSPSMMISTAAISYSLGMVGAYCDWLAWGLMMLSAMVFVPHYLNTRITTMPEFIRRRFDERCRTVLTILSILSVLILWLGGTLYAGGVLLSQLLNWPFWLSCTVLMVIATSFTVAGGLAAVIITDTFQSILMILSSTLLAVIMFVKVGGFQGLVDNVPAADWQLFRPIADKEFPWPAVVMGYCVAGIWFWCTDQTIVQRVLGARSIPQGQMGVFFAAAIKVFSPLIFFVPGIMCKVLHPDLASPDDAYATMVTTHLPVGFVGLIVAVLIAALVSTIDSGLNSLSTVFTIDLYARFNKEASAHKRKQVGRIVTLVAAFGAVLFALSIRSLPSENMFVLLGTIISYIAPTMSAVFIVGVLWKRANSTAAFHTLVWGSLASMITGVAHLKEWPSKEFWPHFMYVSSIIFGVLVVMMVVLSLLTRKSDEEEELPSIAEGYRKLKVSVKPVWAAWGVLALVMTFIYVFFQVISRK